MARKKLRVGLLAGKMPLGIYERGCQQVLPVNAGLIQPYSKLRVRDRSWLERSANIDKHFMSRDQAL